METTSHPHAKIELDTDLTLFPKINSKVEHRSNYKMQNYKTPKFLQDNIENIFSAVVYHIL